jgi:alanyl aminopeptidase
MNADRLVSARKVRQPSEVPGDIANAFDSITYAKGSAVIGMFENYVGAKMFQKGVQLFLARHAWKSANTNDFLSTMNSAAQRDIGSAFSTFLDQGGAPLLHIDVACRKVHVRQERFLPLGSEGSAAAVWKLPVCVKWSAGKSVGRQCVLVTKPTEDFVLRGQAGCPAWFMANENGAGYYRTVIKNSGNPELNATERVSALFNMQALFGAGLSDAGEALGAAIRFAGDPSREVVQATMGLIGTATELTPPELRPNLARLIRSAYGARATELGWTPKAGESKDVRELRGALVPLVAITGQDASLRAEGSRLAREWLDDRGAVHPDLAGAALSVAAWDGDRKLFYTFLTELKRSKTQRDRITIVSGLRSFGDPDIIRSALDLLFAKDLEPRELTLLLTPVRRETRPVIWDFVKSHFDELNARLPGARGIPFAAVLPLTASGFCSEPDRLEVQSFFNERIGNLKGGVRNLAIAL